MDDTEGIAYTDDPGAPITEVQHFDFAQLDSLENEIKERIAKGQPFAQLVETLIKAEVEAQLAERFSEAIAAVLGYIVDAQKPRLQAFYLAWVTGMRIGRGESLPELARRFGVSKQAFCQNALALAKKLELKPARAMRSEIGKAMMRKAHFKNSKS